MASTILVKSFLWLAGCGAISYALLQLTPDNQGTTDIYKKKYNTDLTEEQKKNKLLFEKLQASTKEKPIYLQKEK